MFLVADIGNSNIVIAIHDGEQWKYQYRYDTKQIQPKIFYETGIRDLLLEWEIPAGKIENAAISSVVPDVTDLIHEAFISNIRFEPLILSPKVFKKLDMKIPKIYEIGSDIVANAFVAKNQIKQNSIIVDFGTALTFTIVKKDSGIEGVTIAPGLKTIISTLSGNTAQLPEIEVKVPVSAIGTSTSSAIRAGVFYGFVGLVKEILSRIQKELDGPYLIVATGGLSTVIEELKSEFDQIDKELTLEGIRQISLSVQ
ncbi:MAG: type III pantothenate kinase [Saprospiraceae bacterium]|nr:type III pantothenate kinase [Saprospiraceae bacterium]